MVTFSVDKCYGLRKDEFELIGANSTELYLKMLRTCLLITWGGARSPAHYHKFDEWLSENATDLYYIDDEGCFDYSQFCVCFSSDRDAIAFKLQFDGTGDDDDIPF